MSFGVGGSCGSIDSCPPTSSRRSCAGRAPAKVFAADYVKGADAWHLACALYAAGDPRDLTFLTLDRRQRTVARRLGFRL